MLQSKLQPPLPMSLGKKGLFCLNCSLQSLLLQCVPDGLDTDIKVEIFLEFSCSISCPRGDFVNYEPSFFFALCQRCWLPSGGVDISHPMSLTLRMHCVL